MKISLALICAVTVFSFACGSPVVHTRDFKITKECDPGYTWCKNSERCCESCQNGFCYVYQATAAGKKEKVKQSFELEYDASINSCSGLGDTWCSHLGKCCRYGATCGPSSCTNRRPLPLMSSCIYCRYSPNGCCNYDETCLRTGCHSKFPAFAPPSKANAEDYNEKFNEMIDARNEEFEEFDLE